MYSILIRRYSLIKLRTFRWMFCFAGPIITFIYILAVKPYGFRMFSEAAQIKLALYYSVPVICIWAFYLFILQPIIIKKLNILNTILYLAWINLFIGFYYYSFTEVYLFESQFDWYFLPDTLKRTLLLGLVVAAFMVIIHSGYLIRKRVQRNAESIQEPNRAE